MWSLESVGNRAFSAGRQRQKTANSRRSRVAAVAIAPEFEARERLDLVSPRIAPNPLQTTVDASGLRTRLL